MHFLKLCSTGQSLHTSLTQTENKPPLPSVYWFQGWLMTRRVMSSQLADQSPSPPSDRTHISPKLGSPSGPPSPLQSGLFAIRHASHVVRLLFMTPEHRLTCADTHTHTYTLTCRASETALCACILSPRLDSVPERLRSSAAPITGKDSSAASLWGDLTAPTD